MPKLQKLLPLLFLLFLLISTGCDLEDYDDATEMNGYRDQENGFDETGRFSAFDFDSYYDESDYIILAYFEIDNGALGQVITPEIDHTRYSSLADDLDYSLEELIAIQRDLLLAQTVWDAITGLIPEQYLGQIGYFELFTDGTDNYLGAIEEIENEEDSFIFSLDISDMLTDDLELETGLLFDTITHELAHIITLSSDQAEWLEEEDSNPATYFIYEYDLDTYPDSYLNLFYQRFWGDIYAEWSDFYYEYGILYEGYEDTYEKNQEILQEYLDDFHERYEDRFVSDYAATSPAEDIAESFMFFVLNDPPENRLIRDQKCLFFYEFPEMLAVRDHARKYLENISTP